MESVRFGGAFDCVGGDILAGLLATTAPYGNVASCGLAASATLSTTVMPFIIRGVSLLGVASAGTARDIRDRVWKHLGDDWKPAHLGRIHTRTLGLDELPALFEDMLAGRSFGRSVVRSHRPHCIIHLNCPGQYILATEGFHLPIFVLARTIRGRRMVLLFTEKSSTLHGESTWRAS